MGKYRRRSTESLVKAILDYGYSLTDNVFESIYILDDGRMISGDFDCGLRGTDHRMIECAVEYDRYDPDFWEKIHRHFRVVRMVPEAKIAMIIKRQRLTPEQKRLIEIAGYEIERY